VWKQKNISDLLSATFLPYYLIIPLLLIFASMYGVNTISFFIKIRIQALAILLVLGLFSCRTTSAPAGKERTETGMASFYANKHNGKKTASGERYQSNKLTAAHKNLAFGTIVKVTNLSTANLWCTYQ
jgi:hypothetical protein